MVLHALIRSGIRTANRKEFINLGPGHAIGEAEEGRISAHSIGVAEEFNAADGGDKGDDFDAVDVLEPFFGNGAGGNAGNGLAGAGAAAAGAGFDGVLFEVGPVGVGGARVEINGFVAIVFWALVFVGDGEEDGGSEGAAEFGAGVDGYFVFFVAGSRDGGLAGPAAVELRLDVIFGEFEAGGAVVDDAGDGFAVGFARAGGG